MLERSIMQSSGFRNLGPADAPSGFQLRIRLPNYRGQRLSLVDGVDVTVNGERFDHADNLITVGGKTYDLATLRTETEDRWPLDELATVIVAKPGGLPVGVHRVEVAVRIRQSYIPIEFQPSVISETRTATIVF